METVGGCVPTRGACRRLRLEGLQGTPTTGFFGHPVVVDKRPTRVGSAGGKRALSQVATFCFQFSVSSPIIFSSFGEAHGDAESEEAERGARFHLDERMWRGDSDRASGSTEGTDLRSR